MQHKRNIAKQIVFSLIPAALFFLMAETVVRLLSLDRPTFVGGGFADFRESSLSKPDTDLGWSLKPNYRGTFKDEKPGTTPISYQVTTNSLGLRSPEFGLKLPGEFRILSLGESSAFGMGMDDDSTYSAILEKILNRSHLSKTVRVINAAVSAYSSYQSLKYLKLRGLGLKPDLVLFYHELNDYLPTTIRDTKVEGPEMFRSDKDIYDSRLHQLSTWLLNHAAIYRFLTFKYIKFRVKHLENAIKGQEFHNPLEEIGFPKGKNLGGCLYELGKNEQKRIFYPDFLGRRVSDEERQGIFNELLSICQQAGIHLIIIHPSYRLSIKHECVLTRFCQQHSVPMLETYDILHPAGTTPAITYLPRDAYHPSYFGHESIAQSLSNLILSIALELAGKNPPG